MSLEGFDPDLSVVDRALVFDEEGVVEAAAGFGFDLADLAVESLVKGAWGVSGG